MLIVDRATPDEDRNPREACATISTMASIYRQNRPVVMRDCHELSGLEGFPFRNASS
jgi:hypothetical protein